MYRKITVFSLCLIGIVLVEQNSFSQEEGGQGERVPEEAVVRQDSTIVFENGDVEYIVQPAKTPFNIPTSETQKRPASTPINSQTSGEKSSPESQIKPKETKQDFSFNIIYYLIYKFKQVDN